jgi:hypothetical protein
MTTMASLAVAVENGQTVAPADVAARIASTSAPNGRTSTDTGPAPKIGHG